ncbi:hypothetical protein LWI29_009524 [Acer saccharum]|uniref:Uncharacterized protein n=1 Tax=Acer saccharum TaxID=4024 RepID=A0AA39RBZ5_ACESA|nr:hypothetical protein LWI29_009524 [Acer saccharum]
MAALLRESDEVREDHATEADVIERIDGACLDVFGVVVVETTLDRFLHVVKRKHRLHVLGQFRYFHSLDLVVHLPQCHSQIPNLSQQFQFQTLTLFLPPPPFIFDISFLF